MILRVGPGGIRQLPPQPVAETPATQPARKTPDALVPFVDLSTKCTEYDKAVRTTEWQETFHETYDAKTSDKWLPKDAKAEAARSQPAVTAETIQGHESAVFDATAIQGGIVNVGGLLRGDFAVEMTCSTIGGSPCDMSLMASPTTPGPGFQFGGYMNSRNALYVLNPGDPKVRAIDLKPEPRIVAEQWYKVRVEYRGGIVKGYVDGVLIGQAPSLPSATGTYQPTIYIWQTKVAVDEVKVESMAPAAKPVDPEVAFTKIFGEKTHAEVTKQIDQLVEKLDDESPMVREEAQYMLQSMGVLVIPSLKEAASSGLPEMSERAQQLLSILAPPMPTTQPAEKPVKEVPNDDAQIRPIAIPLKLMVR